MKGDFSRSTFDPQKHYSRVLMQQGRVHLDADWNEHIDIEAHLRQTRARDMIGLSGAPRIGGGFQITVQGSDLTISPGRIYVDGILCENDVDLPFTRQPDLPEATLPSASGTYLAYLDVWERYITPLEDEGLREVALGGPEAATRTKIVWQVKLQPYIGASADSSISSANFKPWPPDVIETTGTMTARAISSATPDNNFYRVEIHSSGSSGTATFKWSRDNGSVVGQIEDITGDLIQISLIGRLPETAFAPGQWVELSDEARALRGEPGIFVQLKDVQGHELTVMKWPPEPFTLDKSCLRTVRRWDAPDGAIPLISGSDIALEHGVQVKFSEGMYRSGDYWTFPARAITRAVEWPRDGSGPLPQPPQGVEHHYCQLALVTWNATTKTFALREDGRFVFSSLADLKALNAVQAEKNAPDGAVYVDHAGNVGIGTTNPLARLSVVASAATQLGGTARSATLLTCAGTLGNTVGSELALATIGFRSRNSTSLSIRALRTDAPRSGVEWQSTAIGLGMDVDNTVRAGPTGAGTGASLWLHANGNIGIGTSSPEEKLQVAGNIKFENILSTPGRMHITGEELLYLLNKDGVIISKAWGGNGNLTVQGNAQINGSLGIGTATPKAKVHVVGDLILGLDEPNKKFIIHSRTNGTGERLCIAPDDGSTNWYFSKGITLERGGNVGIGTENPEAKLHVDGNLNVQGNARIIDGNVGIGTTTPRHRLDVNGLIISDKGLCSSSSRRWKKNIRPIEGGLNKVQSLRGVSFDWEDGDKRDIGLVAEEVGEVIPEIVTYEENGKDAQGLDYSRLVAVLIEAVKEQQGQIEELKAALKLLMAEKPGAEETLLRAADALAAERSFA